MCLARSAKGYFARLLQAFNGGNPDTHGAVVMAPELVLHSDWLFQVLRRQIQVCPLADFNGNSAS